MEIFGLFGSRTITEHVLRGILAFGAVVLAIRYEHLFWPLFVFLPAAFLLWRGCPACWALGFYETIVQKFNPSATPPNDWMSCSYKIAQKKLRKTIRSSKSGSSEHDTKTT